MRKLRKRPGKKLQQEIRLRQNEQCFYCFQLFGEHVELKRKTLILQCVFDHLIPFAYLLKNPTDNFVGACQVCNRWKSSRIFGSIEEARLYLTGKWKRYQVKRPAPFPETDSLSIPVKKTIKRKLKPRRAKEPKLFPDPDYYTCYVCGKSSARDSAHLPCCSYRCSEVTRLKLGKPTVYSHAKGKYKNGLQKPCLVCQSAIPQNRIAHFAFYCSDKCLHKAAYARQAYRRYQERLAESE